MIGIPLDDGGLHERILSAELHCFSFKGLMTDLIRSKEKDTEYLERIWMGDCDVRKKFTKRSSGSCSWLEERQKM